MFTNYFWHTGIPYSIPHWLP